MMNKYNISSSFIKYPKSLLAEKRFSSFLTEENVAVHKFGTENVAAHKIWLLKKLGGQKKFAVQHLVAQIKMSRNDTH